MLQRKSISVTLLIALGFSILITVSPNQPVQAQAGIDPNTGSNDNCIKCHEDLYFLHDIGKWYCVSDAPMSCTGCHGGNTDAIDKEAAHANRAAHPIINKDVTKCQQCHPEKCDERVEIFRREAGLPYIMVAAPFLPDIRAEDEAMLPAQIDTEQQSSAWGVLVQILPFVLVAGAALAIYVVYRIRHPLK